MEDREGSYFTTPTFQFLVQNEFFYVPTGLITRLSSPLKSLITLDMKEKNQGFATLGGVTPATFDRFLEWATKGFYTPPLPSVESQAQDEETYEEPPDEEENENGAAAESATEASVGEENTPVWGEDVDEAWGHTAGSWGSKAHVWGLSKQEKASKSRQDVRVAFYTREPSIRRTAIFTSPPRRNLNPQERYTDIFLCHAKLYVFADAQDIQELKTLALEELHAVLAVFEFHLERTLDVLELLRFVYDNTTSPLHGEEPLRSMLSDYLSLEIDTLMLDGRYRELMLVDGGDMLADFMSSVSKRIKGLI